MRVSLCYFGNSGRLQAEKRSNNMLVYERYKQPPASTGLHDKCRVTRILCNYIAVSDSVGLHIAIMPVAAV